MGTSRFNPKLNKRYIAHYDGHGVYGVNPFAVRNLARPDEEFTNFATQDEFPKLIPKGEIWVADKSLNKEGIFFIANAVARMKEKGRGRSNRAYNAGVRVERFLREKLTGRRFRGGMPDPRIPKELYVEHYLRLPDPEFSVDVWIVEGSLVRTLYKTDYTEGGHGYVYRWVPRHQIWVERDLDKTELPFIVSHEYIEVRLMRDEGIEYDKAHEICANIEYDLRKDKGIFSLLSPQGRRLTKKDLPKLCSPEIFAYVTQHHLKNRKK